MKLVFVRAMYLPVLLLSACATVPAEEYYNAPIGNFSCGKYPFGVQSIESIGPHGGTIRIRDGRREIRFDLEEFNPSIQGVELEKNRQNLYRGYLFEQIIPNIKNKIPTAELLEEKPGVINKKEFTEGYSVYQSVIYLPKGSPSGNGEPGVRGQVQYTDGRFMFTVSNLAAVKPQWTKDEQISAAYQQLLIGLSWCQFPR